MTFFFSVLALFSFVTEGQAGAVDTDRRFCTGRYRDRLFLVIHYFMSIMTVMTDLDRYYAYYTEYLNDELIHKCGWQATPQSFYEWVCSAMDEYDSGETDYVNPRDQFVYDFVVTQLNGDANWLTSPQASGPQ